MDAKELFAEFEKGVSNRKYNKSVNESPKKVHYINDSFKVPKSKVSVITFRYEDINGNLFEITKLENVDGVYVSWSFAEPY